MPKLLLASLLVISSAAVYAQKDKDVPAFGKVEVADLQMKACEMDKDADAMYLLEAGTVEFQKGSKNVFALKKEMRRKIKIFNEKGFRYADVKIPYYSDDSYEKFLDLDAVIYNLDAAGKVVTTRVDKKSIFKQKLDSKRSAYTFTFPEVKAGSILEYRYTIVRDAFIDIDPWVFQDHIPTKLSVFRITLPGMFRYTTKSILDYPVERKSYDLKQSVIVSGDIMTFNATEFTYKMKDIPAMKSEPFMGSYRDYMQRLDFQLNQIVYDDGTTQDFRSNWPALAKMLMESEYFGLQFNKNISKGDELTAQLKGAATDLEKMNIIYKYVQNNIAWNGVHDFYSEGVKNTWADKSGSTGDINILLLNLLKEEKIGVQPLLVSTRDHGRVTTTYPFLNQFNMLIILATIDGKQYYLNAADKFNPPGLIPYDVNGTEAFVVRKDNPEFIVIWNEKMMHKHYVAMFGSVDESGVLKGEATMSSFDYAKNPRVKTFKEGKEKFTSQYITPSVSAMKVEDVEVKYVDNDSMPLEQKFKFSVPVTSSGEYKFFNLNMFTGLDKNPFLADNRHTVVEFGFNQYYMMVGTINIPEGYAFEEPPKNVSMIMPDTSIVFRRIVEAKADKVLYRISLEFKRPFYLKEEYPEFKEFYKKLYAQLNEQVVFKKKASPKP